jgi:hypothetical protein
MGVSPEQHAESVCYWAQLCATSENKTAIFYEGGWWREMNLDERLA